VVVPGKEWGPMIFEENMVEVAAVVFNRPGLGGLRLESPTLVTKKRQKSFLKHHLKSIISKSILFFLFLKRIHKL